MTGLDVCGHGCASTRSTMFQTIQGPGVCSDGNGVLCGPTAHIKRSLVFSCHDAAIKNRK